MRASAVLATAGARGAVRARPTRRAAEWAGALSMLAAAGHALVMVPHFREWWAYGAFFLACAVAQTVFGGLVLVRPRPALLLAGIAGNLAIVGLYVLSRTNGVPLGPHAGRAEDAALLDLTCTATELGVLVACVTLLPRATGARVATALMLMGVSLWSGRFTGVLL